MIPGLNERITSGYSVTWKVEEAKALLSSAKMRVRSDRVQVRIEGKWMHLCRTDLVNDVGTYRSNDARENLDNLRNFYLRKIIYGARKGREEKTFAVIDSLTDG